MVKDENIMVFFAIIIFLIFGGSAMKTGDWNGFLKIFLVCMAIIFILYLFGSISNEIKG